MMKIVVFLSPSIGWFGKHVLEHIRSEARFEIVGAVIDINEEPSIIQKLRKNIRQGRGGYIFIMAYHRWFDVEEEAFDTKAMMTEWQVPVLETQNPYCQEGLSQIKNFKADIGVLMGAFGIVKRPLIDILDKGILSYHHGNMRHYRGQPPAFWELYHDEAEMGVTVQRINHRLDRGEIILETTFPIDPADTLESLNKKIFQGSSDMMKMALLKVGQPDFKGVVLDTFGKVYTLPNLRQWLRFKRKMWQRKRRALGRATTYKIERPSNRGTVR